MTSVAQGQVQRRTKLAPYHLSKLKPAVLANEGANVCARGQEMRERMYAVESATHST